jgi:hypothetical protein
MIFTVDDNGNITKSESSEGTESYTVNYAFDELDHRTSVSDTLGQVAGFTPLADGSPSEVFDGRTNKTTQSFSVLGERLSASRPSGVEFLYRYDANRQNTFTGDSAKGHTITYDTGTFRVASQELRSRQAYTFSGFNDLNLPDHATTPVGDLTLGFDLQGRLISQKATHQKGDTFDARFVKRITANHRSIAPRMCMINLGR